MEYHFSAEDILNAKSVHLYNSDTLYIVDGNDNAYGYYPGRRSWYLKENFWDYFDSSLMLSCFRPITKEEAAQLYCIWTAAPSDCTCLPDIRQDLADAVYQVYDTGKRCFTVEINAQVLTLSCTDHGPECRSMSGDDTYEFYYQLRQGDTHCFLTRLRKEYGHAPLGTLLVRAFGTDNGPEVFRDFCFKYGIAVQYFGF